MHVSYSPEEIAILRRGGINDIAAGFLRQQCMDWQINKSIEIGVASGYGSSIILGAGSSEHHGVDVSPRFYLDSSFPTGALALEDHRLCLHIGTLQNVISELPPANLIYIDADHRHPRPSVDLWNLVVGQKINYPFLLILDDIGLAYQYRQKLFSNRGPFVLGQSLNSKFKPKFSPKINLNGVHMPNQAAYVIDSEDSLMDCLLVSFSFQHEIEILADEIL